MWFRSCAAALLRRGGRVGSTLGPSGAPVNEGERVVRGTGCRGVQTSTNLVCLWTPTPDPRQQLIPILRSQA